MSGAGEEARPGGQKAFDVQGNGQSAGIPAAGEHEGQSYSPLGNPGINHWQEGYITRPGFDDRSSVFFAAVEMTRMPMLVADPNRPDLPAVFVNRAFLELTLYPEKEVIGRNCRFLQGPGRGTSVRMIFPVAVGGATHSRSEAGPEQETTTSAATILVVEDNDDVRSVAESHLVDMGYRVRSARSGEEALALLDRDGPVDLLFTDLVMPGGMNGLVLSQRVRERVPDLPVLMTTGYTDEMASQAEASTVPVLGKPYRRADLVSRIRALLGERPARFQHEG